MKEFFAGGNTVAGFVNYLPRYVEGLKNIILLYGCPGCGKSSLLKRFAAKAGGKGYEVTAIRCSSDADSLDGTVVPALSLGIVDATAPHVINPIYPLAVERIVDLTQFAATPCRSEKSRITPMVRACALAADFAGGLGAGIAASAFNKQKPLPTALSAGLIVCIILFVTSVIFDYGGNAWIAIGLIMAGALIAALVPAFSIKTNNQRRLGTAKHLSKRSVH